MWNARLDETQARIKIAERNINNHRYAGDISKEPLVEDERGEWKTWLKTQHLKNKDHGIWSHHLMANRRGKNGKQWKALFWGGSKITVDGTAVMKLSVYSLEEKPWQA